MKDQNGNDIPTLALIDGLHPLELTDSEIKRITNVRWYDVYLNQSPNGEETPTIYLMADYIPIEDILPKWASMMFITAEGVVSEDLGGILVEVVAVNDVLKRWDIEDGFHHA